MLKLLIIFITFFFATAFTESPNDEINAVKDEFFNKDTSKTPSASGSNNSRDAAAEQLNEYKSKVVKQSILVTGFGAPVDDLRSVLTAGPRGPILLQDTIFIDHMAHFDRERIPERVVHARGNGAFGYFEVTDDITKYTKASVFSKVGKKTSVGVRFSNVIGKAGSAETVRDPRGFSIKFYTDEGIWDLVGLNTPIFFIRDAMLFPLFIHSQKPNPVTNLPDFDMMWDFISLRPETIHMFMRIFSDQGIPDGVRHIDGFGVHTFKLVNKNDEAIYCKFHLRTNQGIKNLTVERAGQLAGEDPDYTTRDLYNAIKTGNFPSWKFYIQVMTFEQAKTFRWNPFDATKIWPESEYPLIPVGKLVLNRNPSNFFADVEQIAFCPSHLPPGIEPTPDKMLQGRLFSYSDTQRYRLGPNHLQLPVNLPHVNITNYQRDGPQTIYNQYGAPNYFPNSFSGPKEQPSARIKPFPVTGDVDRYDTGDDDNYSQPTMLWNSMNEDEQKHLVDNLVDSLGNAQEFIQKRAVKNFYQVDQKFGDMLTAKLASRRAA